MWGCHVIQDIKDMTKILGERIAFFLRTPNLIIVLGGGDRRVGYEYNIAKLSFEPKLDLNT